MYGCFLKWWYPTTMGFPTKNDHFEVYWGYHHLHCNYHCTTKKTSLKSPFGSIMFSLWPSILIKSKSYIYIYIFIFIIYIFEYMYVYCTSSSVIIPTFVNWVKKSSSNFRGHLGHSTHPEAPFDPQRLVSKAECGWPTHQRWLCKSNLTTFCQGQS